MTQANAWPSKCPACRCSTANGNLKAIRGFGICRDVDRLAELERDRRSTVAPATAKPDEPTANVLAFPAAPPPPAETAPALSPGEHSAFEELARELNARLKNPSAKMAAPTPGRFRLAEAFRRDRAAAASRAAESRAQWRCRARHP